MLENPRKFCMAAADLVIEAKFLADFNHPHILGIRGWTTGGTEGYGDNSHDGYFLIVERLYETLEQRMERWTIKGISDDDLLFECTRIGAQIASALEYLHSKNIIFRDIKPNNIGFDAKNDIKIFDLGLCRELPPKEATTDVVFKMSGKVGTLRYMSPECAMSESYGVSSDVYGFAMVLYEMMNRGQKPFAGYSRNDHMEKACKAGERPVMNESWPIMIQDLLERGWSRNIDERPTMAEVAFRLQDIMMDLMDGRENDRNIVFRDSAVSASFPSTTKLVGEDRTGSVSDFSEHEASVEL
jgi:serine/threonine protein kinase